MKGLEAFQFKLEKVPAEYKDYEAFLGNKHRSISETKEIIPFFKSHKHLSAFIASNAMALGRYDQIKYEFSLAGNFRADLVVCDSVSHRYCFIEFEDARRNSIFRKTGKGVSEWSPRFEHGFSQIVDWFCEIDDQKNTRAFRSIFGSEAIQAYGILVIGRDAFLTDHERYRLAWRCDKVLIDSHKIICLTFDQLAKDIKEGLSLYPQIYSAESQPAS
ncbi:MAG: DUF4263 domain-containing protein [Candidatus Sumerlaeota bacterium]|nr:DUF4263 domain-containing protein [Candidatus Sumerlaeota bacterium]